MTGKFQNSWEFVFRIGLCIDDMHRRPFKQRPTGHAPTPRLEFQMRMLSFELRGKSVACPRPKGAALSGKCNVSYIGLANPGGRFDQRIKHRLQIERGAADELEHIGGGGLLLEGLAQFVEQPRILDRDHRLSGEIFNQLDLLVGERLDDRARKHKYTDRNPLSQKGYSEAAAIPTATSIFASR